MSEFMSEVKTSVLMDRSMHQFVAKALVIAIVSVISAWIMFGFLDDFADTRIRQLRADLRAISRNNTGRAFWTRLEENIVQAADASNDLPPERKAKLLAAVRTLAERWRPFVSEITAADPNHSPPMQQK